MTGITNISDIGRGIDTTPRPALRSDQIARGCRYIGGLVVCPDDTSPTGRATEVTITPAPVAGSRVGGSLLDRIGDWFDTEPGPAADAQDNPSWAGTFLQFGWDQLWDLIQPYLLWVILALVFLFWLIFLR